MSDGGNKLFACVVFAWKFVNSCDMSEVVSYALFMRYNENTCAAFAHVCTSQLIIGIGVGVYVDCGCGRECIKRKCVVLLVHYETESEKFCERNNCE